MQELLAEAVRFFLTSFRYKLYFSLFMIFVSNCLKLIINIVSHYRLRAICGLEALHFNFVSWFFGLIVEHFRGKSRREDFDPGHLFQSFDDIG